MSLITPAQAREEYPALKGEDALLTSAIAAVDRLMAGFCAYPFDDAGRLTMESSTYTIFPDVLGDGITLDLQMRPIVSVTSIHVDDAWDYGADALVDPDDYVLDANKGRVYLRPDASAEWSSSLRATRAVVVAGFASTPDDLVKLAALAVRQMLDLRHFPRAGSTSVNGTSHSVGLEESVLPPAVRNGLGPYRLWGRLAS